MTDRKAMLPLAVAAQILQTTSLNILMHIKRGLLQGTESDGVWLVDSASLQALLPEEACLRSRLRGLSRRTQ